MKGPVDLKGIPRDTNTNPFQNGTLKSSKNKLIEFSELVP